jgi:hypothetical protein
MIPFAQQKYKTDVDWSERVLDAAPLAIPSGASFAIWKLLKCNI